MALFENLWAMSPEFVPIVYGNWLSEMQSDARSLGDAVASGSERANAPSYSLQEGVAVIRVRGALDRETCISPWSGCRLSTGYDDIKSVLETAANDPAVSSILFSLDSPGGSVSGCKELADSIAAIAKRKPCAAYADGVCASAAFWLASATGRIYAPSTAQVGSIGVVLMHSDISRLNEKLGVSYSYITGGEWKAVGNENGPLSPESRAYLQQRVNALHGIFRADVAQRMGLDMESPQAWGDGQTFLAGEAHRLGLVTAIVVGLEEAIHVLSEETHMDKETLAAKHPELLAKIEAEAKEAARQELAATTAQSGQKSVTDTLALVGTVLGADAAAKVEALVNAGVTPEQLAALSPLMKPAATISAEQTPPTSTNASSRAAMLAAMEKATPGVIPGAQGKTTDISEAKAAVDRMANIGV